MADNNAAYYYHFDGLGSVVALSDSDGDSCQSYEYSAYGQVAASDPNFLANPYMFTGRRFDIETGLYYYRARYYNPHIGRFMQTDPIGYGDGINWYAYCGNNPVGRTDPSGLYYTFLNLTHEKVKKNKRNQPLLTFAWVEGDSVDVLWFGINVDAWYADAPELFAEEAKERDWVKEKQTGYELSLNWTPLEVNKDKYTQDWFFWRLQAMRFLNPSMAGTIGTLEQYMADPDNPRTVIIHENHTNRPEYGGGPNGYNTVNIPNTVRIDWHPLYERRANIPSLVCLAHEFSHALDYVHDGIMYPEPRSQDLAIGVENTMRGAYRLKVPGYAWLLPRRVPRRF